MHDFSQLAVKEIQSAPSIWLVFKKIAMIHVFMTTLVEGMPSVQLDLIYQHAHV